MIWWAYSSKITVTTSMRIHTNKIQNIHYIILLADNHMPNRTFPTTTTSSSPNMIASRLIVHLSVVHLRVTFFITRTLLSSKRLPMQYTKIAASIKISRATSTSTLLIDVLYPLTSPIPWYRLVLKHSLCLLPINKRYGKQMPPRERRARVCFQLQYLLHLPLKKLWFTISELSKHN